MLIFISKQLLLKKIFWTIKIIKEKKMQPASLPLREGSFQHTFSMAGIYALADIERHDTRQ